MKSIKVLRIYMDIGSRSRSLSRESKRVETGGLMKESMRRQRGVDVSKVKNNIEERHF